MLKLTTVLSSIKTGHYMQIQVGTDNFGKARTNNISFIDKTLFIKEVLDNRGIEVTLITRPRRFGKTFNLSTLHHFLAKEVNGLQTKDLFNGLKISTVDNGSYMQYQGKYPVIFISFKDIKVDSFELAYSKLYDLIIKTFNMHHYLEQSEKVSKINKELFSIIVSRKANKSQIENFLETLTACLFEHHGVKSWLLIDEYDTPIQSGYLNNYYNEITNLIRGILSAALKTNPYLDRAVITGIVRIAKESLFSGLNNIKVYSILQTQYSEHFGFTESEVHNLLQEAGLHNKEDEVKSWYNGYIFGGTTVYNPWSIVNYVYEQGLLQAYWVNTSDDKLISSLLSNSSDPNIRKQFDALLKGEDVIQEIDENMVFGNLKTNSLAPWSILLMSGYLKATHIELNDEGNRICNCSIPNWEVKTLYCKMIRSWLSGNNDGDGSWYRNFLSSLLNGNIQTFTQDFDLVFSRIVSVHDTARNPENFYHGFMLGLTASLRPAEYEVRSNKESGYGRYDLAILPKDITKYAIIFEFKSISTSKTSKESPTKSLESRLEQGAQEALSQINQKQYITEANHRGFNNIIKIGIAFSGREFSLMSEGGNRDQY
jgi:NADPH-dependent 7-cyano-7-deazaguanine reductase QueF-like protein